MNDILVIDDEAGIRSALRSILEDERYRVRDAADAVQGLAMLEEGGIDLVFLDVLLPRLGGLEALGQIKKRWSDLEVVMISGHANVDMAVRAVKLGAFEFLEKPLSLEKVLTVTRNALNMRKLRVENTSLKTAIPEEELIGTSQPMMSVKALIDQAGPSDARILVMGENGTGKELVARAIHRLSARANKPFVEVNCAAIPDTLIESELFGHEKGAFTDAVSSRKGRFEIASGGTLFLDEIGDMSLTAQAKVLRAIQELKIERVGGESPISVDVRIVAATNKDLQAEVKAGRFREDLYFRLAVVPIRLPPLRERQDDIPLLASRFLQQFGADSSSLSPDGVEYLQTRSWPGNVRELKNLMERVAVMCDEELIGREALASLAESRGDRALDAGSAQKDAGAAHFGDPADFYPLSLSEAKDLFEKRFLEYKLEESEYNIAKTAVAIGVYPSNLYAKIKKYGIRTER